MLHRVKQLQLLTKAHLGFHQITTIPVKSFSSLSLKDAEQSFTVSYLMKSCGFSIENAVSASKKVHFKTSDKPDSIIKLLSNHGFTNAQISKIVKTRPAFLVANPEKTLVPKFQFFDSIGVSSIVLTKIISSYPSVLAYSLNSHIIPLCEFIKTFVNADEKVVTVIKHCPKILKEDYKRRLVPNIAALIGLGVPRSSISMFLMHNAASLLENYDKFEKCVKEVMEKGFNPSSVVFIVALQVIGVMTEQTWNRKLEIYKQWGWSETEFQAAFRSNPLIMNFSEEKIAGVMEFLVKKMGLKSDVIAKNPSVLGHSLEKRIIPRCEVMKILVSRGLIRRTLSLSSYLFPSETIFLNKFVTKYEKDVPQLFHVYKGNSKV